MQIQEKIKNWTKETLKLEKEITILHPKDLKNGDYAFFSLSQNPEDDVKKLEENKIKEIAKIELAGKFINFYLSKSFFAESVKMLNTECLTFGGNDLYKNQKIIIEYTDPNPFKEFHIGHLMSNSIGEAISRIVKVGGAGLKRLSYGGDVGLHVAKAMFGVLQQKEKIPQIKEAGKKEQLKFWAKCYVIGNNRYEDDETAKKAIDDLNKIIFDKSDSEINELYDWGREVSIKHFQEMFKMLDTNFDKNIWESEVVEDALKAVDLGLEKNILERSEGAIIFRGENYGLHTRVFVNSKGVPTYEAKELGLGIKKYEDFSFDKSIVITGNEQDEYFKVVLKATELIKPEVSGKTMHMGHGMLRLPSGKMSSRKGNVITAEDLITQVKEKVLEKIVDRDFDEKDPSTSSGQVKQEIAEMVAIGAIKYSILRQAIGGDIIFDFEKSISFEGDSGPYLQYTAVRANSVLKKSKFKISNFKSIFKFFNSEIERPQDFEITELEKYLYRFPEIVERAGAEYAPHYIVTYLTELASIFNSFYAHEKIINKDDSASPYKIALTQATFHILTSGLHLLGIKAPERM